MFKAFVALVLLLALASTTVIPRTSPIISRPPPVYNVQLDDDPLTRWGKIVPDFKEPLERLLEFTEILPLSKVFFDGVDEFAKEYKHQDFIEEVRAVAKICGFPFAKLLFLNFLYELSRFKACTGIIVRNDEGKLFHARNMDFEMWELFAKLAAKVNYMRGDEIVFSAEHYIGSVCVCVCRSSRSE